MTAAFTRAPVPSAIDEARSSYTLARTQAKASRSRATTAARIPGRPFMSWSGSAVHSTKPSSTSRTEPPKRPASAHEGVAPERAVLGHGGGDGVRHVVEDGGGSDSEKGRIDSSSPSRMR